jgi:hypothetical protein
MKKVIYINSRLRTIEERMVGDFKELQEWVGTGVLESITTIDDKHQLLVDEEGFYHRDKNDNCFYFKGIQNPIIGDGIIVSYDMSKRFGDRDDITLSIDDVKEMVLF